MDYDAIVVGLGGIGSAVAYRLAMRPGTRVLGLEQFTLGHDRGASQDESRIIRLSYHRREYVELAKAAYRAWDEVEAAAGVRIVTRTGGIDLAPRGSAESPEDYATAMSEAGVAFEWLDVDAIGRRWPQWRLPDGTRGLLQEAAGIADPSVANAAHQRLATEHGATLRERARVAAIREHAGALEVEVEDSSGRATHRTTLTAGAVVLATDAWANDLLGPLGWPLNLRVTREQVTWFEPSNAKAFAPERFPVWIWLDDPSFYGFPSHRANGPKAGQDVGGRDTTAATRSYETDPDALARLEAFTRAHLPGLGRAGATKTCLYTLTPDRDFVVDRMPAAPGVVVALGAAHAFKFAALLGERLADLALDPARRPPAPDLALFAIDRPGLRAAPAPTNESRAAAAS